MDLIKHKNSHVLGYYTTEGVKITRFILEVKDIVITKKGKIKPVFEVINSFGHSKVLAPINFSKITSKKFQLLILNEGNFSCEKSFNYNNMLSIIRFELGCSCKKIIQ